MEDFAAWFAESEVVGQDGKPLVVFHATTASFNRFERQFFGKYSNFASAQWGFFFTVSLEVAKWWLVSRTTGAALEKECSRNSNQITVEQVLGNSSKNFRPGAKIYQVVLQARNPYRMSPDEYRDVSKSRCRAAEFIHSLNPCYDSIHIVGDPSSFGDTAVDQWVVFSPEQIRSRDGADELHVTILNNEQSAPDRFGRKYLDELHGAVSFLIRRIRRLW